MPAAFSSLPLSAELLANIDSLQYKTMTPIQEQSLPAILKGRDLLAQAKTGSGKTAAFAIGLLHKLDTSIHRTQAMVLCPTRELADQVTGEVRRLARVIPHTKVTTLCGPGELIDVVVTERGMAINPLREDLLDKVKGSGLPLRSLEELRDEAEKICGIPDRPEFTDHIVAVVKWVDGTLLDAVRQVK